MSNSYILNKVNFQQKKKINRNSNSNWTTPKCEKSPEIEQHPKCEKKDWKEKKGTFQKNPTCVLSSIVCLKYKNAYIM